MRKSNCCKAELLPRTVLCSKCLSEVKIEKLTAEDFIKDNVLKLPFKEKLSMISSVAVNGPRFNKTLIIKFELDKDGMYFYNLPEDMDKVRVERGDSYVVKYGKHVNKIKSLDEVNIMFSVIGNHIVIDSHEFAKLKKSDLILTFKYAKKNKTPSEKIDVCDREKSLKSFIYNLNIAGIENISKDRNKILKSNLDFLQLLSYANVNLHVTKFMDLGNDEIHVEFGRGFLPSNRPSVFTFITKWDYLDQILIKKMVVPIAPVPKTKESLDTLPFPIKIGDKVLFQNRDTLLKYFNIGYHVLNSAFDNKYTIVDICKISKDLFKIIIGDNFNVYESHLLSHIDVFTLFGSDNTLGTIVNPNQQYGRVATPIQPEPCQLEPINIIPGFIKAGQIHVDNMNSMYNLDGMGYLKAKSMPNFETNAGNKYKSITDISKLIHDDGTLKTVVELGSSVTVNKDTFYRSLFMCPDGKIDEIFNITRTFKVTYIRTNGLGYVLTLTNGDISLTTVVLSIDDIEKFFTIRKGRGFTPGFTYADERGFFKTDGTTEKKFDEPIKDEKIVPARIDDDNLFSIGDYVTIKDKDLEKGILSGIVKNPFGWEFFENERRFIIYNIFLNRTNTEHTFVLGLDGRYCGFTIEADNAKDVIQKLYTGEDEPNINTPLKTKKTRTKKDETKK